MLFTLAHELTHHIRKWSPAKFKILADFLMEEYGKLGVNVDGLIREQMAKAKRGGRTISYDTAYEEMVADSMETMLADGNVIKRLAKLKARDQGLWQKIKDFIDELATKIRNVYKGLKADSVEGRYVADMGKVVYRLQDLFAEALVDAGENYQSAEVEKNTTEEGGVKYQARPSAKNPNLLDPRTVTKADVRSLLKNAETGVYDENTYIPVRISTPGIIQERLFAENLPMAMPVKKVIQAFKPDPGKIKGKNVRGHGLSVDELLHIIENLDSPDYLFSQENGRGVAVIKLSGSADNTAVFVEFGDHKNAAYMNGYEGGKYNISITAFDIDGGDVGLLMMQLDKGWTKVFDKQKEGDPAKKFQATRPFAIEQDSLNKNVAHGGEEVKPESVEAVDIKVDTKTESAAPSLLFSERTWTEAEIAEEQVEQADRDLEAEIKYSERENNGFRQTSYQEWDVQSALYDALDHADKGDDNLILVGNVPQFIVDKIGIEGDFYIYRNHAYENMVSSEQAKKDGRFSAKAHYHDLGIEKTTDAVMALEDPIMTIATKTKDGNPAVIMILPVAGKNNAPLYAVLSFYSDRKINGDYSRKPHIVLTIAERDYFGSDARKGHAEIIRQAVKDNRVIDFDKKMRDSLSVIANQARVGDITDASLATNLAYFRKEIKAFKEENRISYSDRDAESVSNRSLLAEALESVAQTDWEKQKLTEYKGKIRQIEDQERKLRDLNQQIKDLSFAKDPRDKAKLSALRDEATKTVPCLGGSFLIKRWGAIGLPAAVRRTAAVKWIRTSSAIVKKNLIHMDEVLFLGGVRGI